MAKSTYLWDEDNILAEYGDVGSLNVLFTFEPRRYGNLISESNGNPVVAVWQYHFDGIGSTVALTNDLQGLLNTLRYDAFGQVSQSVSVSINFCGRIGYYFCDETTNLYVRRRTYDPMTGRWLSVDLIDSVLGRYRYASNNPTRFTDASGLDPFAFGSDAQLPTCGDPNVLKIPPRKFYCGSNVTAEVKRIIRFVREEFEVLSDHDKRSLCTTMYSAGGWDIVPLAKKMVGMQNPWCGPSVECKNTVTIFGACHYAHNVNYILWGVGNSVCGNSLWLATAWAQGWKLRYGNLGLEASFFTELGWRFSDTTRLNDLGKAVQTGLIGVKGCIPCNSSSLYSFRGHLGGILEIPPAWTGERSESN